MVIWPWLADTITAANKTPPSNSGFLAGRVQTVQQYDKAAQPRQEGVFAALSQGETIMSAFVHSATVHAHVHPARFSIGSLIALGGALAVLSRLFGMA